MNSSLDFLANSGDAVCAVNKHQRIVYWNAAAEKAFGFTAQEAIGQFCWQLMEGETPDGKPYCQKKCPVYKQLMAGKPVPHFDLRINTRSGEKILTTFSALSLATPNSNGDENKAAIYHLLRVAAETSAPPTILRIYLLGPLLVRRLDGSQVSGKSWRRVKVRALLAHLALRQGQPVSRQELVEALWPDMDWTTALRNLNTTVYNLRRSLEPNIERGSHSRYIFYESGHYWLGGDEPHWVDATAFKSYIRQAREETAVPQAIALYQKAIQLFRGDYLADVITAGVGSHVEQNRLHQLLLTALEEIGNLYQQQGQPEKARQTYLKILSLDPYRESVCQQLAHLSQGQSNRLDALAYCQRLAATLKDELDLILSQEMFAKHDPNNKKS